MSPPPDPTSASGDVNEGSRVEAQTESPDANGDINAGTPRRSAWNRPSNGVLEPGSVMGGAGAWPALSELTTRPVTRLSPEFSRPTSDGSASSSQPPAVSQASPRQVNANNNNSSSHNSPRIRSRNRGTDSSSGSGASHNNLNRPLTQPPPPFPAFRVPYPIVPPVLDNPMAGARPFRGLGGSQGNDHSSNRNGSRRVNYGPRPRGDGIRRDQDRRDIPVIPPYMAPPMGFMPPPMPPAAPSFIPAPLTVFPGQMGFDINTSLMYPATVAPESYRPMPIVQSPPPLLFPSNESHLTYMILKQIEYYFSDENLVKDDFLRNKMDENGWVPISLIASFRRVQNLTHDIPMILESLSHSTIVEVQGDKVRRRNEWSRWLLSSSSAQQNSNDCAAENGANAVAASLQEVTLNESVVNSSSSSDVLSA